MNIDKPSKGFLHLPGMKRTTTETESTTKRDLRLPLIGMFVPNKYRNHFIAMVGEFLGTFLFLFFAFSGTQIANKASKAAVSGATDARLGSISKRDSNNSVSQVPDASTLLYISLAFGFSLAVNAWVFFRISGGLFNPAVTFGMALIGAVPWVRASLVFLAQMLGAMASSAIVLVLFPGPLDVSTTLGGGTSIVQGLFIEMFGTFMLVFTIFMLAAEKHKGTYLAPVGIGLALFIDELAGVFFTGGSFNPARSFGPAVANADFVGYHWIYWLGPLLGALLAAGFYRFVKILEFETANPGQDFDEKEIETFAFDEETGRASDVARPVVVVPSINDLNDDALESRDTMQSPALRGHSRTGSRAGRRANRVSFDSPGGPARPNTGGSLDSPIKSFIPVNSGGDDKMHPGFGGNDDVYRNAALAEGGDLAGPYRAPTSGNA